MTAPLAERIPPALPAWVRDVELALPLHPQVLITGNVRDVYPIGDRDEECGVDLVGLPAVLWRTCLERGFQAMITLDWVRSTLAIRITGDNQLAGPLCALKPGETLDADSLRELLIAVTGNRDAPVALLIPYAARLAPADANFEPNERLLMAAIEILGHTAAPTALTGARMSPYNTVFWVCERQEELHPTFPIGSHALRVIRIPRPDLETRRWAAYFVLDIPLRTSGDDTLRQPHQLADVTHDMTLREVLLVGRLTRDRGLSIEEYGEAARMVRIGVTEDRWSAAALREKIKQAPEYLGSRVLGQPRAVAKTIAILRRSAVGLNGAQQSSSPNRPRGVLFLAGPTGVGKTELAKGIASLVLGEGAEPIRFDMSEFKAEHSDQRLIGAPPGYVAHDAGGELTNAVRARPVCVLLFDEIEKAHPKILDLFLQILEDGRLTDGRGATVHFTESFLIFTSNVGVTREEDRMPVVHPGMAPTQVESELYREYVRFFNEHIRRPELRNRFGDSYVVLDFIRSDVVPKILDRMLDSVARRVRKAHKAKLRLTDEVRAQLVEIANERLADTNDGGRGIGTCVESALVNPLSSTLFDDPAAPGDTLLVTGIREVDGLWEIDVERSRP